MVNLKVMNLKDEEETIEQILQKVSETLGTCIKNLQEVKAQRLAFAKMKELGINLEKDDGLEEEEEEKEGDVDK